MRELFSSEHTFLIDDVIDNGFANSRSERDVNLIMDSIDVEMSRVEEERFRSSLSNKISTIGVIGGEILSGDLNNVLAEYDQISDALSRNELWLQEIADTVCEFVIGEVEALTVINMIENIERSHVERSGESVKYISNKLQEAVNSYRDLARRTLKEDLSDLLGENVI